MATLMPNDPLVVNEYLQEVFGNERGLLPATAGERAYARILISRCDAKFVKLAYTYLSHKHDETGDRTNSEDERLRQQLEAELSFLDRAIGKFDGSYFLGNTVSLVDIAYIPFFERMLVALPIWKGFDLHGLNLPHLQHWLEVMANRDSYQGTRMTPEKIEAVYSRFLGMDYFKTAGIAAS